MCGKGRERRIEVWLGVRRQVDTSQNKFGWGHVVRVRVQALHMVASMPSISLRKNAFSSAESRPSIPTRGVLPTSFVILFSHITPVHARGPTCSSRFLTSCSSYTCCLSSIISRTAYFIVIRTKLPLCWTSVGTIDASDVLVNGMNFF